MGEHTHATLNYRNTAELANDTLPQPEYGSLKVRSNTTPGRCNASLITWNQGSITLPLFTVHPQRHRNQGTDGDSHVAPSASPNRKYDADMVPCTRRVSTRLLVHTNATRQWSWKRARDREGEVVKGGAQYRVSICPATHDDANQTRQLRY